MGENATQQELDHWKAGFTLYYSRDEQLCTFLDPGFTWDKAQGNTYGFVQEVGGLQRTPERLAADLGVFFQLLAGYFPNYYIVQKLPYTTGIRGIWRLIYKLFQAEITGESLLSMMSMKKKPAENYRCFLARLSGHVLDHLAPPNVTVDELSTGPRGDVMTLSLANMTTMLWLHLIDPRLVKIIQSVYQKELREGASVHSLADRIAGNIDNLLAKTDADANMARIAAIQLNDERESDTETVSTMVDGYINRIRDRGYGASGASGYARSNQGERSSYGGKKKPGASRFGGSRSDLGDPRGLKNAADLSRGARRSQLYCGHCAFLKKVTKRPLNTDHDPDSCRNRQSAIRLLGMADDINAELEVHQQEDDDLHSLFSDRGKHSQYSLAGNILQIQSKTGGEDGSSRRRLGNFVNGYRVYLSRNDSVPHFNRNKNPTPTPPSVISSPSFSKIRALIANLRAPGAQVRRKKSPSLEGTCQGIKTAGILDCGAELNVMDQVEAVRLGLSIVTTSASANAANQLAMEVVGQTKRDVTIELIMNEGPIHINLGSVVVIRNLGVPFLIGEPGLSDNRISTIPDARIIMINKGGEWFSKSYATAGMFPASYGVARITKSELVAPGESTMVPIPGELCHLSHVSLAPRKDAKVPDWFKPHTTSVGCGLVKLTNISKGPVWLKKNSVVADVRAVTSRTVNIPMPSDDPPDPVQFTPTVDNNEDFEENIKKVKIDPDNMMPGDMKQRFKDVTYYYRHLFTARPGKYNGNSGIIDNSIDFTAVPAPNTRIHLPSYSPNMTEELCKKMDQLMDWGVLMTPEDVGVRVKYCSPSMIVPKQEEGEFRLVTDFSGINEYIRKSPGVSPSIQEAKRAIASKKYRVDLDLSNYFYQSGMSRRDIQYLGTHHPIKGMLVYTCQPQGLKNASEDAYEKLARIFSTELRQGNMTRMADGLHVLGDTFEELLTNYTRCLQLIEENGFTLKPSKAEICPKTSYLFGWKFSDGYWTPTEHTISALASYEKPKTIKQLRSFTGSFKQISQCIQQYAPILHELEAVQGGKASRDYIQWTPQLEATFNAAKEAARDPQAVVYPRPDDIIHTYSDFSSSHRAIGGRMMIERKMEGGVTKMFLGGHFSMVLDKFKEKWTPCEGEALGIRLTLDHFADYIRESNNQAIHHTDSKVCVQAWHKAKRGEFSTSARVAAFLSGLTTLDVKVLHTPGKDMWTSDFASRHPPQCKDRSKCQLCAYAEEWQIHGDLAGQIKKISAEEVLLGRQSIPYTNRGTWLNVQANDPTSCRLTNLIATGQAPPSKKTGGEFTRLKQLHTLFSKGQIRIEEDGLITMETKDGHFKGRAVYVPNSIYTGVIQAIHLRLDHPSKHQMTQLLQRYFYTPGGGSMISDLVDSCHRCMSLKKLPAILAADTTSEIQGFGSNYAADVVERCGQKFLIVRENLSSLVTITTLENQTADSLRQALLDSVLDTCPDQGCSIRTDGAAALQSLAKEADMEGSIFYKFGITICVGNPLNKNRNPIAETAIKEFHKEVAKAHGANKKLSKQEVSCLQRTMNSRIRSSGYAAREIMLRRDIQTNSAKDIRDETLEKLKIQDRTDMAASQLSSRSGKVSPDTVFQVGDMVFLRAGGDKLHPKENYVITFIDGEDITIRKIENQFRAKTYKVKARDLVLSPISENLGSLGTNNTDEEEPVSQLQREEEPVQSPPQQKPVPAPRRKPVSTPATEEPVLTPASTEPVPTPAPRKQVLTKITPEPVSEREPAEQVSEEESEGWLPNRKKSGKTMVSGKKSPAKIRRERRNRNKTRNKSPAMPDPSVDTGPITRAAARRANAAQPSQVRRCAPSPVTADQSDSSDSDDFVEYVIVSKNLQNYNNEHESESEQNPESDDPDVFDPPEHIEPQNGSDQDDNLAQDDVPDTEAEPERREVNENNEDRSRDRTKKILSPPGRRNPSPSQPRRTRPVRLPLRPNKKPSLPSIPATANHRELAGSAVCYKLQPVPLSAHNSSQQQLGRTSSQASSEGKILKMDETSTNISLTKVLTLPDNFDLATIIGPETDSPRRSQRKTKSRDYKKANSIGF